MVHRQGLALLPADPGTVSTRAMPGSVPVMAKTRPRRTLGPARCTHCLFSWVAHREGWPLPDANPPVQLIDRLAL